MRGKSNTPMKLLSFLVFALTTATHAKSGGLAHAEEITAKKCLDEFVMNVELASKKYAVSAECEIVETSEDDVAFKSWFSVRNGKDNKIEDAVDYFDVRQQLLLNKAAVFEERALICPRQIFYAYGAKPQHIREYPRRDVLKKETGKTTGMEMSLRVPNLFAFTFLPSTSFSTKQDSMTDLQRITSQMPFIKEDEDITHYYGYWEAKPYGFKVHFSKELGRLPTIVEGYFKSSDEKLAPDDFEKLYSIEAYKVVTEWKRLENNLYYPTSIANTVYRFSPKGNSGREMHVLAEWSDEVPGMESLTADSLNAEYSSPPGKVLKLQAVLEERLSKRKTEK